MQKLQESIRKPSFQEIARQNAQQLALSQAPAGGAAQGPGFEASGSFGGGITGMSQGAALPVYSARGVGQA